MTTSAMRELMRQMKADQHQQRPSNQVTVAPPAAAYNVGSQDAEYIACGTHQTRSMMLDLRLASGRESRAVPWLRIEGISLLDGRIMIGHGGQFSTLSGMNLTSLYDRLVVGNVGWIQEFNPQRWHYPNDQNAPLVDGILFE